MNKKILAILSLAILAIVCMGTASAFDLGSLLSIGNTTSDGQNITGEGHNITIEGIDFFIPAGFEEEKGQAMNNKTDETDGVTTITSGKTFSNNKNDVFSLAVATYEGYEVDDDIAKYVGDDNVTINGVDGYTYDIAVFDGFAYAKDGKLVIITATDKNLFDQVVVG